MATESARLRLPEQARTPEVVEYTRREIADDWLNNLHTDAEAFYRALPAADEAIRDNWRRDVENHPFEIDEEELLGDFTQVLDLREESDENIQRLKRKLLIDLVEHRVRPFAQRAGVPAEAFALGMIDEAKAFGNGPLHVLRDQVRRPFEDEARKDRALAQAARDAAAHAVPEAVMVFLLQKEEARRAGEKDPKTFGPEEISWLRENPSLLIMQARNVDPDTADINTVKERAGFPPKEAAYVLSWLRQAGDSLSPERLREAMEQTFPKKAFEDDQKRAAFRRVMVLLEGYPQSMHTPEDIGLPSELERDGRPLRMFKQLRRAIDEDAASIPTIRVRNQEHTRFQDRAAKDYNHAMEVYAKQTLPQTFVRVIHEYNVFANTQDMQARQQAARRMAGHLTERLLELTDLDADERGRMDIRDEAHAEQAAATAARNLMPFFEGMHRTWHGDGQQVSAFLREMEPYVQDMLRYRLLNAFYTREMEDGSLEAAEKYGTRRKLVVSAIDRLKRQAAA